jgi:uncharacterized protein with gpF-like domain
MGDPDAMAAMTDAAASDLQDPLEAVIDNAMQHAMDLYAKGQTPAVPDDMPQQLLEVFIDGLTPIAIGMGESILEMLRKDDTTLFERVIQQYIEQFGGINIQRITTTTMRQINALIAAGAQEGDSVDEIARAIFERIPQIARTRAAVIARTETHSASQFASLEVAKTINRPVVKQWNSVEDHRTRDFVPLYPLQLQFDHRSMDGQQVAREEPFRVPRSDGTFEELMFPGDQRGSPGNTINCRCVMTYEIAQ